MWIYIEENIELLQKEVISGKDKANEMRTLADLLIVILSLFCLFLQSGSYYVDETGMELIELCLSAYLYLTSAGVKGMHCHIHPCRQNNKDQSSK